MGSSLGSHRGNRHSLLSHGHTPGHQACLETNGHVTVKQCVSELLDRVCPLTSGVL